MRALIAEDPFCRPIPGQPWAGDGQWPAAWIGYPEAVPAPFVSAYRLRFESDANAVIRIHVSADERYQLFLDGQRVGRGSERGCPDSWFYETYDVEIKPGNHCLAAQVWSFGPLAPIAQMHHQDGFLLCAETNFNALVSTGTAPWEVKLLGGYRYEATITATGPNLVIDAETFSWAFESGLGEGWKPARSLEPAYSRISPYDKHATRFMKPAVLPAMLDQRVPSVSVRATGKIDSLETQTLPTPEMDLLNSRREWLAFLSQEEPLTIAPHTGCRVIVDLENYYCAYPHLVTSGGKGSLVRISWAEALFEEPGYYKSKGNRNEINGKYFLGLGDTFLPDGGDHRPFETLWWKAGRYLEIVVQTDDQPLILEQLKLQETRYPLEMESSFTASDPRLASVIPILVRGMQMDAHETYMDCPYYEQLMYAGDTRLEILTSYVMARDDRLAKKAIRMFDLSRRTSGITLSRFPTSQFQVIPPFTLWWVGMARDFAFWRGDVDFLRAILPGVHAAIEGYDLNVNPGGLLQAPEGWNFTDWVPGWNLGIPPDGELGISGLLNWQYILALKMAAELETLVGHAEMANLAQKRAASLALKVSDTFWDGQKGLFADDLAHQHFSEHTQCLALLSGRIDPARKQQVANALINSPGLTRTTVYFTHYLFEAFREIGRIDALFARMGLWFDLVNMGFKTPVEQPEPSRSDCHAWGSHPLYHYFSTLLGIRPASLGFRSVSICPQLGPLLYAQGQLVHPRGEIRVDFRKRGEEIHGQITLPEGVSGSFESQGQRIELHEGDQQV